MSTATTVSPATAVVTAARRVRSATTTLVTGAVITWLSVQAFGLASGVPSPDGDASSTSEQVALVVSQQEATGLTCRAAPALTDSVVVQLADGAGVTVLPFDDAIDALRDGSGSPRRYCL